MNILVLETDADSFFLTALNLEKTCPEGQWKYCKFLDKSSVNGIFQCSSSVNESFSIHKDFFKYFLGLFNPKAETAFDLHQEATFVDFCKKLNSLLIDDKIIYDLSVSKQWIWSEGNELKIPEKLRSFLDFE